ncbi:hypothetical protein [Streptomyces sp. NPDC101178]|uniref:hypothetical protein n=1 Tax=Streptomyces sp. NPDC101178 TaxID=3366124 RepID=UPI00381574C3
MPRGLRSRTIHLAACGLAAGVLLTGLVPASGAAAAPAGTTAWAAADDPAPPDDMPDDGFDDEHEGEQDDLVGPGGTPEGLAPGTRAEPVPGRAADFRLAAGSDLSGLVGRLDAALPKQGLTELMATAACSRPPRGRSTAPLDWSATPSSSSPRTAPRTSTWPTGAATASRRSCGR